MIVTALTHCVVTAVPHWSKGEQGWNISCCELPVLWVPLTCIKHLTVVSAGTLQWAPKTSQGFQINPDNLWWCERTRLRICLRNRTAWSFLSVDSPSQSVSSLPLAPFVISQAASGPFLIYLSWYGHFIVSVLLFTFSWTPNVRVILSVPVFSFS